MKKILTKNIGLKVLSLVISVTLWFWVAININGEKREALQVLRFNEIDTKSVPVKPLFSGFPGKGYYIKSIMVFPEQIVVRGANTLLQEIEFLTTEPVDISGRNVSFEEHVQIIEDNRTITIDKKRVKIKILIAGEYK